MRQALSIYVYFALRNLSLNYSMNHLLIDGYNLILSDEKLSKLMRRDPTIARETLIDEIRNVIGKASKITLIFDGRFSHEKQLVSQNFEIQFSQKGEPADDVIKDIVGRAYNRRSITVVTNDLSIIAYARECGSKTMKCGDFVKLLRTKKPSPSGNTREKSIEKPQHITNKDLELLKKWSRK